MANPGRELLQIRRYRLIAPLPITASFPSVVYVLQFEKVHGCPQWRLAANSLSGSPCWVLCQSGDNLEPTMLRALAYEKGFELLHPSASSTIMELLCRHRRAVHQQISK